MQCSHNYAPYVYGTITYSEKHQISFTRTSDDILVWVIARIGVQLNM